MSHILTPQQCRIHQWERQLEVLGGVECVVQICERCGRKEVCWSERPLPADVVAGEELTEELLPA